MNDQHSDLQAVTWLSSAAGRREAERVRGELPLSPAQLQRLRNRLGRTASEWLVATAALRKAAHEKLGIDGLLVTDRGLQQSTDRHIADYKASRFPAGAAVWDLCCGIGGDALALARRGPLIAVDRDPLICRLAAHNLTVSGSTSAAVVCQAVDPQGISAGSWIHVDPDRRPGERRVADPHRSEPPASTIEAVLDRAAGGAIKLAPAADVPERWSREGAREWISQGGSCRQQVVWFAAELPAGTRVATVVGRGSSVEDIGAAHTFTASHRSAPAVAAAEGPRNWLFDFDPAVRAAGLTEAMAEQLGLAALGGPAGFLTAEDRPNSDAVSPALYQSFQVLWEGPMDEKKLRRLLADFGVGSLEIKVRGVELAPETLRKRLLPKARRGGERSGERNLTLLIGRVENRGRVYAAVAERCTRVKHV
ncbi:class I SAM-dependent methyltransferase [Candidatus Laterigemmans baculatus]|uniref:class I SAM-dependent methyltransferase n=1 Tax=Candidatus Laterigemmans baculatus TaxID=2770505 RepID=UPI0013D91515|nr:class I SAM-dependent methyltransferase [Candidatus Laterigemmans baculatus]